MFYISKRLLLMVPTILSVTVFVFVLMRVVPGDIVELRYAEGGAPSPELIQLERARFGLDKPLWRQFADWFQGLLFLDLGQSMWTGQPILSEIAVRLPLTLELAILATAVSVALALPLGTLAAVKQDRWLDYGIRVFSIAGVATPSFWLGILTILLLLSVFKWLPPLVFTPLWQDPLANLSQMIWPALAVGYRYAGVATRMMRSAMLEVLGTDYIRTASAKGLPDAAIVGRHALRNAVLPVLTIIGLEFSLLMGGLVVTEQVFNLNGLGLLFVQSVFRRDYTMVQALVLLFALGYVVVNLLVDLLYAVFDPRIAYE